MFCSLGCSKLDPKTHRLLICCLRSLRLHSSACFIASMGHFGIAFGENHHLEQTLIEFNGAVEGMEGIGLQDIIDAPPHQRQLSSMIEDHQF